MDTEVTMCDGDSTIALGIECIDVDGNRTARIASRRGNDEELADALTTMYDGRDYSFL